MSRDGIVGLSLAACIFAAWAGLLWTTMFALDWAVWWPAAPLAIALQCWLYVGLFIIVHDAIHGTLVAGRPRLNRTIGRFGAVLYAGFDFDALAHAHRAHHRHSGTAQDPDFDPDHPGAFWPWYVRFFRHYFGWRQFATLAAASVGLAAILHEDAALMLPFWALPAVLSSLQIFYFGTFLPHRHEAAPFADRHRTRSTGFAWPVSLLTCFHFGHHHAHHVLPHVPWWRLPAATRQIGETS